MAYELRLLGPFQLLAPGGEEVTVAAKKNQALIAILALAEGANVPRSRLTGILWAERGEDQARNSLRQAFASLRKAFSGHDDFPLIIEDDHAAMDSSRLTSDTQRFLAILGSRDGARLEEAVALWRGELLEGLTLAGEAGEAWLDGERRRLHTLFVETLSLVMAGRLVAGDHAGALGWARRLIAADPLNEPAHRAAMSCHAATGERAKALKQYNIYRDMLERELGVAPDAATEQLRREIAGEDPTSSAPPAQPLTPVPAAGDRPSLAVLPFTNLSGDSEQRYFSDGITGDIITELSRFRSLFVIARNSSFAVRYDGQDLTSIGSQLGARFLVAGSVRRSASRVRISVELIEAASGIHLWAERYDRDLEDIFAVQDEITRLVVTTLVGRLDAARAEQTRRKLPDNLTAYDLLLRGLEHYFRLDKAENHQARALFERAIAADPGYAEAHYRLAWTRVIDFELGWSDMRAALQQALAAAQRAVDLEPGDARAQAALGYGCLLNRDYERAEQHIEQAHRLNPNDAELLAVKCHIDTCMGRAETGRRLAEEACRRNPFAPDWYYWCLGFACYLERRYTDAVAAFTRMNNPPAAATAKIAASLAQLGRREEATRATAEFLRRAAAEQPDFPGSDKKKWLAYWTTSIPLREQGDIDHLVEGLRKAGLPI